MAKKKALPPSFNEVVCDRLRQLAAFQNEAIIKKKAAEEERDEVETEINLEKDGGNHTRLVALKERHSDAVLEIRRWAKVRKACGSKIITTILKGDQGELFEVEKITEKSLFEAEDEPADDDNEGHEDIAERELAGAEA